MVTARVAYEALRWRRARAMQALSCMAAIAQIPDIHHAAGARWLAPFTLFVLGTLLIALVMFIYPYVAR
jgi:hypothetical protein